MRYDPEAKLWLPGKGVKMDRSWRFVTRNVVDLNKGIEKVKKRSVAMQAGGHLGIFPNFLAKAFDHVVTFEPDPDLFACLVKNVAPNVRCINAALSNRTGWAQYDPNVNGIGRLKDEGSLTVETIAYSELDIDVNFIHLDIEGHEVEALRGAAPTIEACSPILQLEVLPRFKEAIYQYIEEIGYKLLTDDCRDHVFVRDASRKRCPT